MDLNILDILLPVNRASEYLEDSLKSIAEAQQYLLDELQYKSILFIITNGLDYYDATRIKSIAERSNLCGYKVLTCESKGISNAINKGIHESNSPFIARADDDDLIMKERFVKQIENLKFDSTLLLVGTYATLIDGSNKELGKLDHPKSYSAIQDFLFFQNCFVHSSVMFRRSVLSEVGFYRPSLDGVEDYDLWCRISNRGKVINLPEYLIKHRIHDQQTTHILNFESDLRLKQIFLNNLNLRATGRTLSDREKHRICCSLLALNLSRRYLSLNSRKRVLAFPYMFKSWILSPVSMTRIFLRILKFKCFSK